MTPFNEKLAELGNYLASEDCPLEVVEAAARLTEHPQELFWFVPPHNLAIRAPNLAPGLQPSDLLLEMVLAARAREWPKVLILIQQALCHSASSHDLQVTATLPPP